MLVVISDLHFQDTVNDTILDNNDEPVTVDRNVSSDAFQEVFEEILTTANGNDARELIIILAGDIFDLNRSQQWLKGPIRPYGEHSPDEWYPVADGILRDIIRSNDKAFAVFREFAGRKLKNGRQVAFQYLPGNHDRLINLHPELRKKAKKELLGQSDPDDGEFAHVYRSDEYGVLIRHGHEYDRSNFAGDIPEKGAFEVQPADYARAPLGDYATIDIAAGLASEYRALHEDEIKAVDHPAHRSIYCKLLEFDDLRPQADIIDFLQSNTDGAIDVWKYLTPAADSIVTKALKSKFLRSKLGTWGKILPLAGLLPVKLLPAKFIIKLISGMHSGGPQPWQYARREAALNASEGRYVVAGHTHSPCVEFLRRRDSDGKEQFFFDTGTWRQQIRKCQDCVTFARAKALTYVVFYSSQEDRHHASGNKGYSFDYWSGFTKKEVG
jgi:UDP-2,3-diacylglucosamine pyrophosphatase LpxH